MKIKLENTRSEITGLDDLKQLLVKDREALRDFSVKQCTSLKHRVRDGPMINVPFNVGGYETGEFELREPLLFVEEEGEMGEIYVTSNSLYDTNSMEPPIFCTQFPLRWHEKECGLDVRVSPPKGGESIQIGVKDQNGEHTIFEINPNCPMECLTRPYAQRKGVCRSALNFLIDGETVQDDTLLSELDMEDGDFFDCFLCQRGGMYHWSSGRNGGFGELDEKELSVRVRYGPDGGDEFAMRLSRSETRETLICSVRERISAIRDLQSRIEALKNGDSERPRKKGKA